MFLLLTMPPIGHPGGIVVLGTAIRRGDSISDEFLD
jgi:hypothetical protein